MAAEFKVYDLEQVSVILGGIPLEGGAGEGGFVSIAQQEADFKVVIGSDGSVTRSKTGQRYTQVTITCMQTSAINAILSTLNNVDRAASNGAGVVPMLVNDKGGLSLFAAQHAWVEGPPEAAYNNTSEDREWVIGCALPERFDGGN